MKIRVGIFFGGKSVEHEVSVISAIQAASALDPVKYESIPVYITKDNELYTGPDLLIPASYRDLPGLLMRSRRAVLVRDKGKVYLMEYPKKLFRGQTIAQIDVAFPVVHGTNVEDGSLQGFLQLHGLPYVGSDVGASAGGMDKWTSKCLMQNAGIPVLPGYCFRSTAYDVNRSIVLEEIEKRFIYPMIVKPVNLGSSVGIGAAHDREELEDSIELAASFAERILIEPMLTHMREINCAVLGDSDSTEVSVCEEPLSTGEILSYRDKYLGTAGAAGQSQKEAPAGTIATGGVKGGAKGMESALRKMPADLEADKEEEIKALAQAAFSALNCSGAVRVDFLYDQRDGKVYVNELNTIPGSLSFYLWEAAGKPFRQLTDDLVQLALKRSRLQERLIWSNDLNLLAGIRQGTKGVKG